MDVAPSKITRLWRLGVALATATLFAWGGYALLGRSHRHVEEIGNWTPSTGNTRSNEGPARLFRELVNASLVRYQPRSGRVHIEDCDFLLRNLEAVSSSTAGSKSVGTEAGRALDSGQRAVMTRLCRTDTGASVSKEVDAWNNAGRVVAIRDSRIPAPGTPGPVWSMSLAGGGDASLAVAALAGGEPSDDVFAGAALAARNMRRGKWNTGELSVSGDQLLTFTTSIDAATRSPLHIQTVGEIKGWRFLDGQGNRVRDADVDDSNRAKAISRRIVRCQEIPRLIGETDADPLTAPPDQPEFSTFSLADPCGMARLDGRSVVARFRPPLFERPLALSVPRGATTLEVDVKAFRVIPRQLYRLGSVRLLKHSAEGTAPPGLRIFQRISSLELRCRRLENPAPAHPAGRAVGHACLLDWVVGGRFEAAPAPPPDDTTAEKVAKGSFQITARDNTVLAAAKWEPPARDRDPVDRPWATPAAQELGVASWVGLSGLDGYALGTAAYRAAGAQKRDITLELSIDPQVQALVDRAVRDLLERRAPESKFLPSVDDEGKGKRVDSLRRASIVIMSAKRATAGEILAAASWPRVNNPAGLNYWDVRALDRVARWHSPLASRAWADTDQLIQPGSTFKVVSALALLQAYADDPKTELRNLLRGVSASSLVAQLGVQRHKRDSRFTPIDRQFIDVGAPVHNNNYSDLTDAPYDFRCRHRTEFYQAGESIKGQFGLRHALGISSNIWFAGMVAGRGQKHMKLGIKPSEHPLALAMNSSYNFLGSHSFPLVDPAIALGDRQWRAGRVEAQSITASFLRGGIDGRISDLDLGRASYGQKVQATPTSIATIMAAIALGEQVRPTLLPYKTARERGDPLLRASSPTKADELMNELRCGLQAVVSGNGTGKALRAVSPRLADSVYAKTGTAQVEGTDLDTAWFAGWVEWENERALQGNGRHGDLAFACMVTHADKGGGTVCAPLIARLLLQIRGLAPEAASTAAGRRPAAKVRPKPVPPKQRAKR